jgi:hypothetical protein
VLVGARLPPPPCSTEKSRESRVGGYHF